jgi:hypothetical protein
MHFVGEGVGFLGRVVVIVFLVFFVIFFPIAFVIGIQGFLQLFHLRGFHKRFGHGFDGLGPVFGLGLGFLMLGFGKLLGEGGYLFLGKASAIGGMRVRDHARPGFGIEPVEVTRDIFLGVGRRRGILRRASERIRLHFRNGILVFFRSFG